MRGMKTLLIFLSTCCYFVLQSKADSVEDAIEFELAHANDNLKDFFPDSNQKKPSLQIESIWPQQGPRYGDTRVVVRGGPLSKWQSKYNEPKCKFGDLGTVGAAYIRCPKEQFHMTGDAEQFVKKASNYICLICNHSPAYEPEDEEDNSNKVVNLQISLIGDFSDSRNSVPFTYYPQLKISSITPRYGLQDGGTKVRVVGKNFQNLSLRCAFGLKTTSVIFKSDTELECESPPSEVLNLGISFAISMNEQQFISNGHFFYYYNRPEIMSISPVLGPETGNSNLTVSGTGFMPFKEILNEIDNSKDAFCSFIDSERGMSKVQTQLVVESSTKAYCQTPEQKLMTDSNKHTVVVEITLNNQQYTDDEKVYTYYKTPIIANAEPLEGPLRGGTNVTMTVASIGKVNQVWCNFGDKNISAELVNSNTVICTSPAQTVDGKYDLRVGVTEGLWSSPIKFTYYGIPQLSIISPECGPDTGYTQIQVEGEHFVDLGTNKALCVFNRTTFTNATIFSNTMIVCDSPPYQNNLGYSLMTSTDQEHFYEFAITIDGGKEIVTSPFKFYYYRQPKVVGVQPFGGPIDAGTTVTLNVTDLDQFKKPPSGCANLKVRLGTEMVTVNKVNGDQVQFAAPKVAVPGTVHIQVSINEQQFSEERTVHLKDPLSTYEFYTHPLITFHSPQRGLATGNTKISILGNNFKNFKPQQYADPQNPQAPNRMWVRMIDTYSKKDIMLNEIDSNTYTEDLIEFQTAPAAKGTKALIEISRNGVDWHTVKNPKEEYSFTYVEAPILTSISPNIGPVKPKGNPTLQVTGTNFVCSEPTCLHLKARFTDADSNQIYTQVKLDSSSKATVNIPKYTQPGVLTLELTFNGKDYTSNGLTYGFFDPFLLDMHPKLISASGNTKFVIQGLGFVNSKEMKVKFTSTEGVDLMCGTGNKCVKTPVFIQASEIESTTYPQAQTKDSNSTAVKEFKARVSMIQNDYVDSSIVLYYFNEPAYKLLSKPDTPANIPSEILIQTAINSDDMQNVKKYGLPKCRFSTVPGYFDTPITILTEGVFVHSLEVEESLKSNQINAIRCVTPVWTLKVKKVKIDVTINDYDYSGAIDFEFAADLSLHRVFPIAQPMNSASTVQLLGEGLRSPFTTNYNTKWGVFSISSIEKTEVKDYKYQTKNWLEQEKGNQQLQCYAYEASIFEKKDDILTENASYQLGQNNGQVLAKEQLIMDQSYTYAENGGPSYIQVGRAIELNQITMLDQRVGSNRRLQALPTTTPTATPSSSGSSSDPKHIYYDFVPSSVELYQYKQCTLLDFKPKNGLMKGGTTLSIIGYDFHYNPEWGIIPHCRFGTQIVKGTFDSNVRFTCDSPPGLKPNEQIDFEISLNGHDWTTTGLKYQYYNEPKLTSFAPNSGMASGGTEVFIKGENFPNLNTTNDFNARFTPRSTQMMEKIVPVQWLNDTTLKVVVPGGWEQGDDLNLELTWNGVDYHNDGWIFTVYNIDVYSPRSGPSDGSGGDISIKGSGFKEDLKVICRLNGVVYKAKSVNWNEIKCPVVPVRVQSSAANANGRSLAKGSEGQVDPTFFGQVNFSISPNNGVNWHEFNEGYQYYQQPVVFDISPKNGPAHGMGIIDFYGDNFREEYFSTASNNCRNYCLKCRVGEYEGTSVFVSRNQIRCVIEDMEAVAEGKALPAQVALNGVTWTKVNNNKSGSTFFVPYTISGFFPNSGRMEGGTEVLVVGSGFVKGGNFAPRCKFGTPKNYKIVNAEVVSYNKMICITPELSGLSGSERLPMEVPFSIAFTQDEFEPFTETHHRFRYYNLPVISSIEPNQVNIGNITEVQIKVDQSYVKKGKGFFQPFPTALHRWDILSSTDEATTKAAALLRDSQFTCRWGRFGETQAIYTSPTTLKCMTPSVPDKPEDIYQEKIDFVLTLNGYDSDIKDQTFTFVGTAPWINMTRIIFTILLIGLVLAALIWFIQTWHLHDFSFYEQRTQPNVVIFNNSVEQKNYLRSNANARSMQSGRFSQNRPVSAGYGLNNSQQNGAFGQNYNFNN